MATPRSTPSMNVPATQNTAPVIRFRCLYTYDMRRKAKRWQDGFLRYHTFNKRIMVYDVAGNYVGDHHCRQDEGIQDGDELELDNGALIEVCEPVERTETDLSGLHSNKRKGQGSSPSQRPGGTPTPTTVVYNSSTPARPSLPSQQKPTRSLNDLLGIKKTPAPTQRAGSPQTGPTSNHILPVNGKENERVDYPAKRKKTEIASEKVARRREPASVDLTGPEPEMSRRQTETTSVAHSITTDPKNYTTAPPISHLKPTLQANNIPQRKQTAPNPPPKPREQPQLQPSTPEAEPEPPRNNDPPANILRLPSKTKPSRKKLMYHTILAQQQQQQEPQQQPQPQPLPLPLPLPHPQSENDHDKDPIVLSDDDDNDNPPPSPPPRPQHNTTSTTIPTTTTPKPPQPLKAGTERRTASLQKAHSDPTAFTRFNMTTNNNNTNPPPQQQQQRPNNRRRASESGNSPLDTTDNNNTNEEEPETDGGPWTWEAQYLFDYWPAGRAKPTRTC
ncbi:uncharacterized protein BO87DRAFT_403860 [Aspergillus neoniger CBS 115656]|uniref:5'-3' DNA helicase ZGRF1-like N-terminal domain-containing protein n=1 Tax=Aspergillus neoniger (strain CBS 115656) TaxID=1448310 RepID=A0A318YUY4_ASPNB|nr:hypothetical protein BO87DRAFT_403860 [Aspergillus neoniger CBS 115656]PYH38256.1 hypothetical protein BO87DRAFT_403860 [Aspergillus neoniger CBS 115656]